MAKLRRLEKPRATAALHSQTVTANLVLYYQFRVRPEVWTFVTSRNAIRWSGQVKIAEALVTAGALIAEHLQVDGRFAPQ